MVLLALSCPLFPAAAIPDQIGGDFFRSTFDETFEDFATNPENYTITAAGRPHWTSDSANDHILVLNMPATVFGLPADRITLEEADSRVLRYRIEFNQAKGKSFESVLTNVEAYSGVKPQPIGPSIRRFVTEGVVITVEKHDSGPVTVEFRQAEG